MVTCDLSSIPFVQDCLIGQTEAVKCWLQVASCSCKLQLQSESSVKSPFTLLYFSVFGEVTNTDTSESVTQSMSSQAIGRIQDHFGFAFIFESSRLQLLPPPLPWVLLGLLWIPIPCTLWLMGQRRKRPGRWSESESDKFSS
jgi:hypothetical protein